MTVHNHGTEDGPGLACREFRIDGKLRGKCMDAQVIPDEAVEALAAILVEEGAYGVPWDDASSTDRADATGKARRYLTVAAPHIRAQALEDAAIELDDKRLLSKAFHIFYPEWLRERAAKLVSK